MKFLTVVLTLAVVASVLADPDNKWNNHKKSFGKKFRTVEHEEKARARFLHVDNLIEQHNKKAEQGESSFFVAHNHLSDEELHPNSSHYRGLVPHVNGKRDVNVPTEEFRPTGKPVPTSFDWRRQGWNSPIENQGECGCCWSFSSTASLEAQYKIKKGQDVQLSMQELIDCATVYGTNGCHGAHVPFAFYYMMKHGVTDEATLPYAYVNSRDNFKTCPANVKSVPKRFKMSKLVHVPVNNIQALKEALVTLGPIAIGIESKSRGFGQYKGGVWDGSTLTGGMCTSNIDHAVTLVGYDQSAWVIKNQWGTNWGENGYMRLKMTNQDMCGISTYAYVPQI